MKQRPVPPMSVSSKVASVLLACAATFGAQATPQKAAAFYEEALKLYEKKELTGAALQLKNAIQEDNKMLAAHLLLGRVLLGQGELKGSEAALETALSQGVSKVEVVPLLAQVYLQLAEPAKVLDLVKLNDLPREMHPEVLTLRGSALGMTGNLSAASAAFAEARKLDPTSASPLIAEVGTVLRAGDTERARGMAQKATELAPKNAMAWYLLGTVQQAIGDRKAALASFDKALVIHPKLVDAHVSRASVLLSQGQSAEASKVLAALKEAKVVEPRASFLRATLASRAGDMKLAAQEYNEAASLIDALPPGTRSGSEPLLMSGALSHKAVGNLQKAREYVDTLLARNGRHYGGQLLLANLLMEGGELSKAAPILENLLRQTPDEAQVLFMLGSIHMARRQFSQAAEMFDRASRGGNNDLALRELAFSQFGMGQDKAAVAALEKVFAKNPSDLRAGMQLAVTYARQGLAAKALQTAEAMVKLEPTNPVTMSFLGNVQGRLNDKKGMRETLERVLTIDARFRPTVMNLSWLDMEEGRLEPARIRLQAYLKDTANDPDVLFQLGLLEQQDKRPSEALALWTKADGLQNKDPRAGLASIELRLAQGQKDAAVAAARTLATKYPEVSAVHLALARAQLTVGDLASVRSALLDASKFAGSDVDTLVQTGRLHLAAGSPDGASYAVSKALQTRADDLGALSLQVEIAAKRGQAQAVDAALATLTAKHPGKVPTLMLAGHVAFSRGQFGKAAQQYRQAFDRAPSAPIALTLTQAYVANKEPDKAAALLDVWSQKNPKDLVVLRALAEVQMLQGKTDLARKNYQAVVNASPGDAFALNGFALLLDQMKDPTALSVAQQAVQAAPDQPAYADTYGWMLVGKGDLENGIRVLREARLRDPGNGLIRWHLALSLSKAGRKSEAQEELKAALAARNPPPAGPDLSALKAAVGL